MHQAGIRLGHASMQGVLKKENITNSPRHLPQEIQTILPDFCM